MINELFERELQNTSINDVYLADYIKENYVPISVLEQIRVEIEAEITHNLSDEQTQAFTYVLHIIDKHIAESEE